MPDNFFRNNFDFIRLFAASQVAVVHAFHIMEVKVAEHADLVLHVLYLFPGVPIFFFISGFLISRSYEKNPCLREFFLNRVLRLYPGLIVCIIFSFVTIVLSGYLIGKGVSWVELAVLFLAKVTFLQFYNPDYMRGFGDGVLNGSLWTITVEIQFYLLVPILYLVLRRLKMFTANNSLIALTVIFFLLNRFYAVMPQVIDELIIFKLVRVSFVPWFYMFLLGVLVQRNFEFFYKYLAGKFHIALPLYLLAAYSASLAGASFDNNINPIMGIFLVLTIFSLAYSSPDLSRRLLKGHDISYGLYIYHMPVINLMLYFGFSQRFEYSLLALVFCLVLSVLSWRFIEKPALGWKKHPLLSGR